MNLVEGSDNGWTLHFESEVGSQRSRFVNHHLVNCQLVNLIINAFKGIVHTWQILCPGPHDHEALALPLCYNWCPFFSSAPHFSEAGIFRLSNDWRLAAKLTQQLK